MNNDLAPELAGWRAEVVEFLDRACPTPCLFDHEFTQAEEHWEAALRFSRLVARQGWVGLAWPAEYGGLGRSRLEHLVMMEEFFYRNAPYVNFIGWGLAAGTILMAGTEEQKKSLLPDIASMNTIWAEGLSEPDAGSDLAALATGAERAQDGWRLTGQKTYMTWGHLADVAYVAARTSSGSRRQDGISIFCVDLKSDGVSMVPLYNIAGGRQNHVFFDGVHVSDDMLIGVEGQGWSYIMNAFYRSGGSYPTYAHWFHIADELGKWCQRSRCSDLTWDSLSELRMLVDKQRLLAYEAVLRQSASLEPVLAGALMPVSFKEAQPRIAQLATTILGELSLFTDEDSDAPLGGIVEFLYRRSFANHAGGTPQVKRMVLATRGLGLPRSAAR